MWTTAEVHEKITELEKQIEAGFDQLATLATSSSQLHWLRKKLEAVALVASKPDERSNAEERAALALLWTFTEHELGLAFPDGIPPGIVGTQIDEHGFAAELAEKSYQDARQRLRAWETELKVAQTLLVSARETQP